MVLSMDCYAVLEVPSTASTAVIRTAFRELAHKWHPDKGDVPDAEANRRMAEINIAWEVLRKPETRRLYDDARANGSSWLPVNTNGDFSIWTPARDDIPEMTEVDSGCVRSVGHDGNSKLYIEFRMGGLYMYRGVPLLLYKSMMRSASQGKFVIYNIICGPYDCKRIGA
jgi:curved DNA-binding protein CbpA